jgi:hypothetical protein
MVFRKVSRSSSWLVESQPWWEAVGPRCGVLGDQTAPGRRLRHEQPCDDVRAWWGLQDLLPRRGKTPRADGGKHAKRPGRCRQRARFRRLRPATRQTGCEGPTGWPEQRFRVASSSGEWPAPGRCIRAERGPGGHGSLSTRAGHRPGGGGAAAGRGFDHDQDVRRGVGGRADSWRSSDCGSSLGTDRTTGTCDNTGAKRRRTLRQQRATP